MEDQKPHAPQEIPIIAFYKQVNKIRRLDRLPHSVVTLLKQLKQQIQLTH